MPEIYISGSEKETEEIAFNFAKEKKIMQGDIIALFGDLGAGKTAFTRGLVRFFSPPSRVTSPTFALVNEYKTNYSDNKIFHFDMYRINSEDDLLSIGFYDYLDGKNIIIIEWFDKIIEFFNEETAHIGIKKISRDEREIIFKRITDVNTGY
ncbi:MAG: tRNA (adenosine(37)-N6)-threonylcarbamoyltransferase complex ATPase subunit type 1 TsaE [Oscillospiraceae bacterium]|nr:tRNA (adenosine(37)-N6)-threonylcarbamoyltransferase complex ATPase subunit type 1 TsaE [Oscillospiraceae bacterium]